MNWIKALMKLFHKDTFMERVAKKYNLKIVNLERD